MTRSEQVLKLIVEHYIKTAQPVASKTLIEQYGLTVSSATIRNEMLSLEKEGYLEKPHTSAGRVPSAKGYQYYVDNLREERIDDGVKHALQKVLDQRSQSVEEIIAQSCEILSNMTNLASVFLGPKINEEHLVSLQIFPSGTNSATAVFVTDKGYVENKTFILPEGMEQSELKKGVDALSERLLGTSICDLVPKMEAMKPALTDYMVGQDAVYQALLGAFLRFAGERMNLYGKTNLLDQPEFVDDAQKLRRVLTLLDNPKELRKAMEEAVPSEGDVNVRIGNEETCLKNMAIVSATVQIPGGQNATLNLLGPTRMDYDRAVTLLDYVTKTLDEYFKPKGESEECKKQTSNPTTPPSKSSKPKPPKKERK